MPRCEVNGRTADFSPTTGEVANTKKEQPEGCPRTSLSSNYVQGGPASVRNVPLSENHPFTPTEREV